MKYGSFANRKTDSSLDLIAFLQADPFLPCMKPPYTQGIAGCVIAEISQRIITELLKSPGAFVSGNDMPRVHYPLFDFYVADVRD